MGVFNWNPGKGESVITDYFWVFVGVSGGLTLLTITAWLLVTLPKCKVHRKIGKEVLEFV
jgi:hypothetical protein